MPNVFTIAPSSPAEVVANTEKSLQRHYVLRHDYLAQPDYPCNAWPCRRYHVFHIPQLPFVSSPIVLHAPTYLGGGPVRTLSLRDITPFLTNESLCRPVSDSTVIRYIDTVDVTELYRYPLDRKPFLHSQIPIASLVALIPAKTTLTKIARKHQLKMRNSEKKDIVRIIMNHDCKCSNLYSIFSYEDIPTQREQPISRKQTTQDQIPGNPKAYSVDDWARRQCSVLNTSSFPPNPLSSADHDNIIRDWVSGGDPLTISESGCAVCGQSTCKKELSPLSHVRGFLGQLINDSATRIPRSSVKDRVRNIPGPVLDQNCDQVCSSCRSSLREGSIPKLALANSLWLGEVPGELANLSFVEKMLVQRIHHKCTFIKVASGLRKMVSHVVAFEAPTLKVYDILPPPREDLDDVLAVMFSGPSVPTEKELNRLPLFVRRKYVYEALRWLQLNHSAYQNLHISLENLNEYPEDRPPVEIMYRCAETNRTREELSSFDDGADQGVEEGECPFIVHGLTGDAVQNKTTEGLKAEALRYLNSQGKFLVIQHATSPESIYNNPILYPSMFPWLFPYGLGGLSAGVLSESLHKKFLLMYHDKHFQCDVSFPFVAFSHEQIKATTTSGFLLTETSKFQSIVDRLMSVDQKALHRIIDKYGKGEHVRPSDEQEEECFKIINDIDHIAGKVKGSPTTKKFMRNEIWSLISYLGAPSWYITFAPSDTTHPICLHWAGSQNDFIPIPLASDEWMRRVMSNPVAGARFFHFMVEMFIKHILGIGARTPGVYGDTAGYYGTVEQQGRLTLHLHMLLWIKGAKTPEQVRELLQDETSSFVTSLITYLETTHKGEFATGTLQEVTENVSTREKNSNHVSPLQAMAEAPPQPCPTRCNECIKCTTYSAWSSEYHSVCDHILNKVNVHTCRSTLKSDGTQMKNRPYKGCLDNKFKHCKACFPRAIRDKSTVDPEDGSVQIKHKEEQLNTFTPLVSYLLRCNQDVTSLHSGTAIKAVTAYITSYITKWSLNSYVMFDTISDILTNNRNTLLETTDRESAARKLLIKMANSLCAKMEMGSPMICAYLLGNLDHYKSHKFKPFFWQGFVAEVRSQTNSASADNSEKPTNAKTTIFRRKFKVLGVNAQADYIYRPDDLETMSLYDFIRLTKRVPLPANLRVTETEDAVDGELPESNINRVSSSVLHFKDSHTLYSTHGIVYESGREEIVPNFVGGTLPRRDQGDYEYYCCTMLTLFKPWCSSLDLKQDEFLTWHEVFDGFGFALRHKELMNNFQIKYECLDSRDDFHNKMKDGDILFDPGTMIEDSEKVNDHEIEQALFAVSENTFGDIDAAMEAGRGHQLKQRLDDMKKTACFLDEMHWSRETVQAKDSSLTKVFFKNSHDHTFWNGAVDAAKKVLISELSEQTTKNTNDNPDFISSAERRAKHGDVYIADKTHLEQSFRASHHI